MRTSTRIALSAAALGGAFGMGWKQDRPIRTESRRPARLAQPFSLPVVRAPEPPALPIPLRERKDPPRAVEVESPLSRLRNQTFDPGKLSGDLSSLARSALESPGDLPELERILAQAPDSGRWALARALAGTDLPGSVDLVRKTLEIRSDPRLQAYLLEALQGNPGGEANALLWDWASREALPSARQDVLRALAGRAENLERILEKVKASGTPDPDRRAMMGGLFRTPGGRDALWALHDSDPAWRDGVLECALAFRDPKAHGLLLERLRSGTLTETLSAYFPRISENPR